MSNNVLDPLGHIRIAVSDLAASQSFYGLLFEQLGFRQVDEKGWVSPEGLGIWIIQAAHASYKYVFEAPGLHHLCFKAKSKKEVDNLHTFLMENSVNIVALPRMYPQYTPDYYAIFFSDPDGIELEVAYY